MCDLGSLLGFFEFLCVVPLAAEFNLKVHLSLADVTLDSHSSPFLMRVHIKQSKIDSFRLGKALLPLCPISAMVAYIAIRGPQPGCLFLFSDGSSLSWQSVTASGG